MIVIVNSLSLDLAESFSMFNPHIQAMILPTPASTGVEMAGSVT